MCWIDKQPWGIETEGVEEVVVSRQGESRELLRGVNLDWRNDVGDVIRFDEGQAMIASQGHWGDEQRTGFEQSEMRMRRA